MIASVGPDDFFGDLGSAGVRHLKRYLDYAGRTEHKVRALAFDVSTTAWDVESPFEEEVSRVVRAWGYDVVAQVGCAGYRVDLAVRHPEAPGVFAIGIECDGAAYHSSRVARDRDRLRHEILTGLDWRLYRIWGPSWYRNRGDQEAKLRHAIEAAVAARPSVVHAVVPPEAPTVQLDAVELNALPQWTAPYRVAAVERSPVQAQMHEEAAQPDLCRMIEEVVRVEGPAHRTLVLRRIREAWGVQRAGGRIRGAFETAVQSVCRGTSLILCDGHGFLVVSGSRLEAVRCATEDPRSYRDIGEIPPAELELAVEMLVKDARAVSWDELTARVARLFGWTRRGRDIAKALDSTIQSRVDRGMLVADGQTLRPGMPEV